jgi:deazaflavin-dependent oxidoreductase (nitroreductase family)
MDFKEWNKRVIEEFRANHGKVGGDFEGAPMVLISTTGAKTGQTRVNPLMYLPDGDRFVVFASQGGMPTNPDWYYNLVSNPVVGVELGDERFEADATVVTGVERDRLYAEQADRYPQFAGYAQKTTRTIPVVVLTRRG